MLRSARPSGDGASKHAATILQSAVCCLVAAPLLDALNDCQQIDGLDVPNAPLPEPLKDILFETAGDLVAMTRRPRRQVFGEPLPSNCRAIGKKQRTTASRR
jgi:hypothetical protein